jgi:hypothetical protein
MEISVREEIIEVGEKRWRLVEPALFLLVLWEI